VPPFFVYRFPGLDRAGDGSVGRGTERLSRYSGPASPQGFEKGDPGGVLTNNEQ
jgi:hypothetical protein